MLKDKKVKQKSSLSLKLLPWSIWIFLALDLLFFGWLFHRGTFTRSPVGVIVTNSPAVYEVVSPLVSSNQPTTSNTTPEDARLNLIKEGTDLLTAGKNAAAAAKYAEALKLNSDDEDAHFNLGIALARSGQVAEAKKHYEKALEIVPDYAEVHNNLGNLLLAEGKIEEAITHFQHVISTHPDNANAQNNFGSALARQGKISEAVLRFSKAIELQRDHLNARVNLANAYIAQNRHQEAVRELKTVLRINPAYQPALQAMARVTVKSGR